MQLTTERREKLENIRTRLRSMNSASVGTLVQLNDEYVSIVGPNAFPGTVYLFYSQHLSMLETLETGKASGRKQALEQFEKLKKFGLDKLDFLLSNNHE